MDWIGDLSSLDYLRPAIPVPGVYRWWIHDGRIAKDGTAGVEQVGPANGRRDGRGTLTRAVPGRPNLRQNPNPE